MDIFLTVISGTSIYVLGQIVQLFIITPLHSYRRTILRINHKIKYYSYVIVSENKAEKELTNVTEEFRALSSGIETDYLSIPLLDVFIWLHIVPTKNDIAEVSHQLIRLLYTGGRKGHVNKNRAILNNILLRLGLSLRKNDE